MLWKYIHHLVQDSHISVASDDPDNVLEPSNFLHTTFHQYMSWKLNEITTSTPSPPLSVTASSPRCQDVGMRRVGQPSSILVSKQQQQQQGRSNQRQQEKVEQNIKL